MRSGRLLLITKQRFNPKSQSEKWLSCCQLFQQKINPKITEWAVNWSTANHVSFNYSSKKITLKSQSEEWIELLSIWFCSTVPAKINPKITHWGAVELLLICSVQMFQQKINPKITQWGVVELLPITFCSTVPAKKNPKITKWGVVELLPIMFCSTAPAKN